MHNVEISGPTQQILCSKYHDFLAVFTLAHSKINQIAWFFDEIIQESWDILHKNWWVTPQIHTWRTSPKTEVTLHEYYYRNYSAVRADFQSLHHYPIFAHRNSQKLTQWSARKTIVQTIYTTTSFVRILSTIMQIFWKLIRYWYSKNVKIPIVRKPKILKKYLTFFWNYLVTSKKWEIFSNFCGLLIIS